MRSELEDLALDNLRQFAQNERTLYPHDPWAWACDQVVTIDEAEQQIRPWPQMDYLHDIFDALQSERLIALLKSRRMFVSWALATYCLHQARYHPNHAILWQSETEPKAAFVTDKRMLWMENHLLVPALRQQVKTIKTSQGLAGYLEFPNGSWIKAVPQGADVVRSYTPSILVMDECEFQPLGHEALVAALPFAEKGAKIILASSSNGPGHPLADIGKSIGFTRYNR